MDTPGPSSTTLSDLQLDIFELEHPFQIVWLRDEEMRREHFLDDGADARQRELCVPPSATFHLEKAVGEVTCPVSSDH